MKIAIASDHAGFEYKERIKELLQTLGHEARDFGTHSNEPVDYPLFIRPAAEAVLAVNVSAASSWAARETARPSSPTKSKASAAPFAGTSKVPASPASTTTPTCSASARD